MKAIILSASTGGGHMSAAKSINDHLISNGAKSTVIDTIEYISPLLNKTIVEIYEHIATKNPLIWKMIYKSSNKKALNKIIGSSNSLIGKKLVPLIEKYSPDVIITTHPFATEMISKLKKHKKTDLPLICVMTDYAPHRTWINHGVDAYVVANENMITPMIEMGVDSQKIYSFGIPVDDSFFEKRNKKEILREFGMNEDSPTLLIMAGSGGFTDIGKLYNTLTSIETDFQIIIITGKNKKLYDKMQSIAEGDPHTIRHKILSKISYKAPQLKHLKLIKKIKNKSQRPFYSKKTKVVFFTSEVDKYMWVSDLIITKPGGLTISEALACNLPMALYDAIPGQEEENADFLVSKNMAVKLSSEKETVKTIENLLVNPQKLHSLKYNCENFDKSDCLKNIFNLIKKLTKK